MSELIEQLAKEHCQSAYVDDGYIFYPEHLEAFAKAYQAAAPIDNVAEIVRRCADAANKAMLEGEDVADAILALIPTQANRTEG
jgi:hypothetical protein